jgi:hypothetical protein
MKDGKNIRLSASLVRDYIVCPKRAYYRLYEPEQAISDAATNIGIIVHELIEKYWSSSSAMASNVKPMLDKYNLQSHEDDVFKCIFNFQKFTQYLSEEDTVEKFFSLPYDTTTIVGKMDRITKDGMIFDWKTGNPPLNLTRDPQFILYYLAYKKMTGKAPRAVYYASLAKGTLTMFQPDSAVIRDFETNLLPTVLNQLRARIFPRYGLYAYNACTRCSYYHHCFTELGTDE